LAEDYFKETKERFEENIPEYSSKQFNEMGDRIRKMLSEKESDFLILTRSLKILLLGDWFTEGKRNRLLEIRNLLLKNDLYTETIDHYYDMQKKGGLTQIQILELCCVKHQLIVFIDGEGKGTITEQNYLAQNYVFHGKIIFFIEESKFNELKDDPSVYVKSFPTIIKYKKSELLDSILTYSRFRVYRLAEIIQKQSATGKGIKRVDYESWKKRLQKR